MHSNWLIGGHGPQDSERRGWARVNTLGLVLVAGLMVVGASKCPIPVPPPQPTPSPTASPTLPPTPAPTPSTSPTPTPGPSPTPTATPGPGCPATCPDSAKYFGHYASGNGWETTPRCRDAAYCAAVTGDPSITDCKANPEGSKLNACDTAFLGTGCPIWQASSDKGKTWYRCDPNSDISCDHFQHFNEVDPVKEPPVCAKNSDGNPIAGFFAIVHGCGQARVCNVDATVCSDAWEVCY